MDFYTLKILILRVLYIEVYFILKIWYFLCIVLIVVTKGDNLLKKLM